MATYFSLRDGLLTDTSTYGLSLSSIEKTTNTTGYMLLTSNSWSTLLSSSSADVIDSIAIHLSGRSASPVGTLTLEISSRTVSPTTFGTYPVSSFTSFDGSNSLVTYPLNWQLLKLSSPFSNSTGSFRLNLKTSDSNQLSLIALSTVNGIDYDRMAITNSIDLTGTLLKTGTTLSAASPFGDGIDGSIYFNGTITDGITASKAISFAGDFTIELWTNTSNTSGANGRPIFDNRPNRNSTGMYVGFGVNSNKFTIDRNSVTIASDPDAFPLNQWVHVAYSRSSNTGRLYVGGVLKRTVTDSNVYSSSSNIYRIGGGAYASSTQDQVYFGHISNLRIINGAGIYTSSTITPPSSALNLYLKGNGYTEFLYKSPYSTDYLYNLAANDIHISSLLDGYNTQTITVTADTITLDDLAVHNKGTLTFPQSSTTLTVTKSAGLMVTSEGTLQIGTSSNPVPADTTHQIVLSGNSLNVANGGRLDIYGAYKLPSTRLSTPTLSTARTFTVVDDVSSTWKVNDTLIFTPNTAQSTSYDELVLSSFDSNSTFRTTTSARFAHSVLDYVPSVANLTRNVKIGGLSNSAKGTISLKGLANVNINNTQFNNINIGVIKDSDDGQLLLSGCTLSGDGTQTLSPVTLSSVSPYFNGTDSRINIPGNSGFQVAAGTDFTFEIWFNAERVTGTQMFYGYAIRPLNLDDSQTAFYVFLENDSLKFRFLYPVGATITYSTTTVGEKIITNKWYHLAAVARSSTIYFYLNGKLSASTPQQTWYYSSSMQSEFGLYRDNPGTGDQLNLQFKGSIGATRFVKGLAVYTNNFTPPTSRLTAITGTGITTALLTLQDYPAIDNTSFNRTLTFNNITYRPSYVLTSILKNVNFNNNIQYKPIFGILNNVKNFTDNLILSSTSSGIIVKNLSGDITANNNITIGPSPYGTLLEYNNNNAPINSSIINYNNTYGTYIVGDHIGTISNITNTYNTSAGVYVDGAIPNLSATTFSNITASNGRLLGFSLSGNTNNYLTPITLNINGLVANDNLSGGFEGYNISGNLSGLELNRNGLYGMKTSIGNAPTTIDGITALMNNVATASAGIGILSGYNYYQTLIKNANVGKAVGSSSFGSGMILDSTKFSQFVVTNSTVSGGASDFRLLATRNVLEGSYLISNTNIGNLPVGAGVTSSNYQSDVLKTAGFAFTNMNNASGYNVTYLAAGTRQIDSTVNITAGTSPSERLTPQSTTLKLRSGSKFVALNSGNTTTVSVYVRKSTVASNGVAYNGSAPRLIMKRNPYMGRNSDIVMDQLDTTSENFLKLTGTIPAVTDSGVLEFYVDCDGTQGFINIDNWTAN